MKNKKYHVNPAMNKWEEEQRLARMEKMISRAKSTLPPEAQVSSKRAAAKKNSPYAAEASWAAARGGQELPEGAPVVDVQQLDSLIYNRVQEILAMPIIRRAAAARAAGGSPYKGSSPYKSAGAYKGPGSAPGGPRPRQRPAWNEEWHMHTTSAPANLEDRPVGGVGSRSGVPSRPYDKSASVPKPGSVPSGMSSGAGSSRRNLSHDAPGIRPGVRPGAPHPAHASPPGPASGGLQRNSSLPHSNAPGSRAPMPRASSTRYSGSGAAGGGATADLGNSDLSAIAALNPQSSAAQEAAKRNKQQLAAGAGGRGTGTGGTRPGAASGIPHPPAAKPHGRETAVSHSLVGKAAASSGVGRPAGSASRKPPPPLPAGTAAAAPGRRSSAGGAGASSSASPPTAKQAEEKPKQGGEDGEEDDPYADDDFEDYEDDFEEDEEGGGGGKEKGEAGEDGGEDGGEEGQAGGGGGGGDDEAAQLPDVDLLRNSVNALNGLVKLKIQQELARSQQLQQQTPRDASRASSARDRGGGTPGSARSREASQGVLASMALVGTPEAEAQGLGPRDAEESGVIDGLRQSDLDYLDRLGADPHFHGEAGDSGDEGKTLAIEPGAPAGTAKVWGDRHSFAGKKGDGGSEATGLQLLRAQQEKERLKQGRGEGQGDGEARGSRQGLRESGQQQRRASGASATGSQAEEEDSVLLGETISPRQRSGAAATMQAVGSALAALASSGALPPADAQDLRKETDALFGSLVQLHNLMSGPRGSELRPAPSGEGAVPASGFTPTTLSPAESPSQTLKRVEDPNTHSPDEERSRSQGGDWLARRSGAGGGSREMSVVPPEPPGEQRQSVAAVAAAGGGGGRGGEPGVQLTPKNRLVAEDVAWMAGLVESLSRSLAVDNGEVDLPGV